jgi:hypothetical protein
MDMMPLETTKYVLESSSYHDFAYGQKRHFGELLAVIEGKGFPFAEEFMSRSSWGESGSGFNRAKVQFLYMDIRVYGIENTLNTSHATYTAQSVTLVHCVQLGMCNQSTTWCRSLQGTSQTTSIKEFKDLRVTNVTQRAKL